MTNSFTNVPYADKSSVDSTVQSFNSFYSSPIELHAGTLNAIVGFFTARNFDPAAAQAIAVIIMTQSKKDGLNPMSVLDTLTGLTSADISAFVATIINFNRFKTSFLGYSLAFTPKDEVARNVVA